MHDPDRLIDDIGDALSQFAASLPRVLALSGGRDSMVLLHALHRLSGSLLTAVHINHGLHPEAEQWQKFCLAQCALLKVDCRVFRLESDQITQTGNLEANARRWRYRLLYRHSAHQPSLLMTAHHGRDQSETYLYRQLKGVGVHGAGGMAPATEVISGRLWLVRPMLSVSEQTIAEYAERHQLSYIEDPQNKDLRYDRNWLRHTVNPMLRARFPALDRVLGDNATRQREMSLLSQDLAHIDQRRTRCSTPIAAGRCYSIFPAHFTTEGAPKTAGEAPNDERCITDGERAALTSTFAVQGADFPDRWHWRRLTALSDRRLKNLFYHYLYWRKGAPPRGGVLAGLLQWLRADARDYRCLPSSGLYFRSWREMLWVDDWHPDSLVVPTRVWRPARALNIAELPARFPTSFWPKNIVRALQDLPDKLNIRARLSGDQIRLNGKTQTLKELYRQHDVPPWLRQRVPVISSQQQVFAVLFPDQCRYADQLTTGERNL